MNYILKGFVCCFLQIIIFFQLITEASQRCYQFFLKLTILCVKSIADANNNFRRYCNTSANTYVVLQYQFQCSHSGLCGVWHIHQQS